MYKFYMKGVRNMKDLFNIKWNDIIIGNLYKDEEENFVFKYNFEGLDEAKKQGYLNMIGFDESNQEYKSKKLFSFFVSRIPLRTRRDIEKILKRLNLEKYDEIEILKKTSGKLMTDQFEIEYVEIK